MLVLDVLGMANMRKNFPSLYAQDKHVKQHLIGIEPVSGEPAPVQRKLNILVQVFICTPHTTDLLLHQDSRVVYFRLD